MCSQRSSKQRIRLNLPISALYPHFSVLSPFQRFIPISAFYPHFSVLSPFQRFIPISAFYPHFSVLSPFQPFSVLSPFQFPLSVSVSAIQFQRFIPTRTILYVVQCQYLYTTVQVRRKRKLVKQSHFCYQGTIASTKLRNTIFYIYC